LKIAHLTTVDMSLRYLLLAQLEAARDVGEAIGISAPGILVEDLEAKGIRHIPLASSTRGMDPVADLRAAYQLWKALRREKVDILHTHNPKPGVYGRIVGRLAGVPVVVNTVHGLYATPESPLMKRATVYGLEWLASRFSDAELIQSPEDLDLLRRRRIMPRSKLRLLGNGVDLKRFNPEVALGFRAVIRSELGVGEDQVVVGMVGRLVAEKGIPELIEAAERLDPRYVVVVVGPDDPEKDDALPREMIERGDKAGVRFLGMRQDVNRLYGAFDVFVLPSHREGFPRAAMEAAASGLPIVATDIRGCRQVVDQGVNGHLFAVGDVDGLITAIEAVGADLGLRRRMGKASVARAYELFDEEKVVQIVMATYREQTREKGLEWAVTRSANEVEIRPGRPPDAAAIAQLHARTISTGFLSSLGPRFLRLLYRALVSGPDTVVLVAVSDEVVVGFIAGTRDTGAFYRDFLRRNALAAAWRLLPTLFRRGTIMRVWETLRYGGEESGQAAELLSMAVAPAARGRGVGLRLVDDLLTWASDAGIEEMRVVIGAENEIARSVYERAGFTLPRQIEMHRGVPSLELTWRS
jgi:glycosyltransferase involved in cell wall biosynthesis/ribosomal protein S18 acetylase RimI-like enzyme